MGQNLSINLSENLNHQNLKTRLVILNLFQDLKIANTIKTFFTHFSRLSNKSRLLELYFQDFGFRYIRVYSFSKFILTLVLGFFCLVEFCKVVFPEAKKFKSANRFYSSPKKDIQDYGMFSPNYK